jgi:uncharacterized protein YbjT (DUF2867 family)
VTAGPEAGAMRPFVLGGTGGTGREIVRQALAGGHAVTALARSAAKARDLLRTRAERAAQPAIRAHTGRLLRL